MENVEIKANSYFDQWIKIRKELLKREKPRINQIILDVKSCEYLKRFIVRNGLIENLGSNSQNPNWIIKNDLKDREKFKKLYYESVSRTKKVYVFDIYNDLVEEYSLKILMFEKYKLNINLLERLLVNGRNYNGFFFSYNKYFVIPLKPIKVPNKQIKVKKPSNRLDNHIGTFEDINLIKNKAIDVLNLAKNQNKPVIRVGKSSLSKLRTKLKVKK